MTYQEFDQTPNDGWRQYNEDFDLQILLISDYIEKNNATQNSLRWHLGQINGMNNDYENAIISFKKCYLEVKDDDPYQKAWNYYVAGTTAFMEKDQAKLEVYIDSLQNNDETMNIEVLIRLKENFEKSYRDAY